MKSYRKTLQDIIAMTDRIFADDDNISNKTLDGIDRIKRMAKEALETNQITNAERIRLMNNEELLEFLDGMSNACMDDDIERCDDYEDCRTCWRAWRAEGADGPDCSDGADESKSKEE